MGVETLRWVDMVTPGCCRTWEVYPTSVLLGSGPHPQPLPLESRAELVPPRVGRMQEEQTLHMPTSGS